MAYIDKIAPGDADGLLDRVFQARTKSAGRLWEIVAIQSLNAETLRESMRMYGQVMFGDSPVSRAQREMLAVVTSQVNDCHY
jgi:alkylhydroperoxidase family enzyme